MKSKKHTRLLLQKLILILYCFSAFANQQDNQTPLTVKISHHSSTDDSNQHQLLLRFNQQIHLPGELPDLAMLGAISITPALNCRWFFPSSNTLACDTQIPAEANYHVNVNIGFKALGKQLAAPANLKFTAGSWPLQLDLPQNLHIDLLASPTIFIADERWRDEQLAKIQWRSPSGTLVPVKLQPLGDSHKGKRAFLLSLSATETGIYQLLLPKALTASQQTDRIIWQGHIYQQATYLGWYCWQLNENTEPNLSYQAIDPLKNTCPPSNLALRFVGELSAVTERSGWYQPAPLSGQLATGPAAVAAEFPNPDGSRYLHLYLAGLSAYQFYLSKQLSQATDIQFTTNTAVPMWQLASRTNDEPGPTLIHWPDEIWHQHFEKINLIEVKGEKLLRFDDKPLLTPRLHTQQSDKLNLLLQWQHFSKAAEFQTWLSALWQNQPMVSPLSWQSAGQLFPELSAKQSKPELWRNTPWLNPTSDADFSQHSAFFTPEQIAQSGLYPYRLGDSDQQVQHWLQRPAFNLEVLQLGDLLIRLSDWQNQAKSGASLYRVCPGQSSPLALGQTDQHGLLLLTDAALQPTPGVDPKAPCWIWAEAAEGMATIPLPKRAELKPLHGWFVTSQPVYQQGDNVELMAVLRQRSPQGLIAPTDVSQLTIELRTFSGNMLQRLALGPANNTGWYHKTLPASWFPNAGYYRLSLQQGDTQLESTTIQIARFELPLYRVDSSLTPLSAAGKNSSFQLTMQSMSGQGLANTVRIEGRWQPTALHRQAWLPKGYDFSDNGHYPVPEQSSWLLQTNAQGELTEEFGLPENITISQGAPAYLLRLDFETRAMMGEWQRHTQSALLLNRDHLVGSHVQHQHINLQAFVLQDGKLSAAENIPVSRVVWREGQATDSPLLAECEVATTAQLPITCPLPLSLRTKTRTSVYMHLVSGETEQLTIRRFSLIPPQRPVTPAPLQATLTVPEKIEQWAPLSVLFQSPHATDAVLVLYTDRIHQLIPLKLNAGTTPFELPITPAMAPELRLALFSTNSAGVWSGSYHRIKSSLASLTLPLSLELETADVSASLATSSQQTLTVTTAEDADIALFWLEESLLYYLASNHIERLHPQTVLNHTWNSRAQHYDLAQLHQLQHYEITSWLSPWFAYQSANSVAFNMPAVTLGSPTHTDQRTEIPTVTALKPAPLWLGVHKLSAGQAQQFAITTPQQPGLWHLIAIAASKTKFTQQQHSFVIKDNWQTVLVVPDSHYVIDQAYASVLWFNASQAPLRGHFTLQLNDQTLQQFSVELAAGERSQQAVALPPMQAGSHRLSLWQHDESNTQPPRLLQQQSWQVLPDTVQQKLRLQADDSGMLRLPKAVTQVSVTASSPATLQPDWAALVPVNKMVPPSWEALLSEWFLAEHLTQRAPQWANNQPLRYWALPFQKAGKYSRDRTTNGNNAVTLFSYWLQSLLADPHALPDSSTLLNTWRKQLDDGQLSHTNQALLAWWLSRKNALSVTELLSLRSRLGQQATTSDSAATGAILLLALTELQQHNTPNNMQQNTLVQQKDNWLKALLALGYQDASYSELSTESACWLLLAAGADNTQLQGLRQRLVLTQQATGSFGSARNNAICTAALFDRHSTVAQPQQLALRADKQPGIWHHTAVPQDWLSLNYTQPLTTHRADYSGISISKSYLRYQDGEWQAATSIIAGDLVQVVLTLNTPVAREHVRITDPLLPGMELLARRYQMPTGAEVLSNAIFTAAQQLNRTLYWDCSHLPAGETTLRYIAQVRLPGVYYQGISRAEAVFNPLIFGSTEGSNQLIIEEPTTWH